MRLRGSVGYLRYEDTVDARDVPVVAVQGDGAGNGGPLLRSRAGTLVVGRECLNGATIGSRL